MIRMLEFDNRMLRRLPIDPDLENRIRQVQGACFSRVMPTKVARPTTLAVSDDVAAMLGLPVEFLRSDAFAQVFAGNQLLDGMDPVAACYGGHQFGNWAGQLGDGRAISLGELRTASGEYFELQLKGAGPTPYSRMADGRAVLRSSIREFLCSEAMHHLGVPTTRALSLVSTGEEVIRDMLYDGHPRAEPGAVVCRVAPSFLRFGNFEIFAARGEFGPLRQLMDFVLETYFPELGGPSESAYVAWFRTVVERTAKMIAGWMAVGFVHGVMNTDNMSILGLTIDYGPFGFLDDYSPNFTPNTTDAAGRRYRYANQPGVGLWNLLQLGNALLPLVGEAAPLEAALKEYQFCFENAERQSFAAKLGIVDWRQQDDGLRSELFDILEAAETDYSIFFRQLANLHVFGSVATSSDDTALLQVVESAFYEPENLPAGHRARMAEWLRRYAARLREVGREDAARKQAMDRVNPKYVLRNYVAQMAIDQAEAGDGSLVTELLEILKRPFDEQPDKQRFAEKRPDWARHRPGCSMLSCSS